MPSEHDARVRAFYDHESDDPSSRRRRAAADWGVNEDIFDRMPSRRFARSERRAEHREDPYFESRVSGPSRPADTWTDEAPRGEDAWGETPRGTTDDFVAVGRGTTEDFAAQGRRTRRPADSWTVSDDHAPVEDGKRSIDSWLAPEASQELALVPGESRTVVLETAEPEPLVEDPPARRTVTITGHPDRMPVLRAPRPPRTALERVGASPDRIVGYAVLLGFVLVLIAVLTTGQ